MKLEIEIDREKVAEEVRKAADAILRRYYDNWEWQQKIKQIVGEESDLILRRVVAEMVANEAEQIRKQVRELLKRKIQAQLKIAMKAAEKESTK